MSEEMQETEDGGVRYPKCTVELLGTPANPVLIFRRVRKELIRYLTDTKGLSRDEAVAIGDEFQNEATSSTDVLAVCFRWVDVG